MPTAASAFRGTPLGSRSSVRRIYDLHFHISTILPACSLTSSRAREREEVFTLFSLSPPLSSHSNSVIIFVRLPSKRKRDLRRSRHTPFQLCDERRRMLWAILANPALCAYHVISWLSLRPSPPGMSCDTHAVLDWPLTAVMGSARPSRSETEYSCSERAGFIQLDVRELAAKMMTEPGFRILTGRRLGGTGRRACRAVVA